MSGAGTIRPKALAVIRRGTEILVTEYREAGWTYHRPPGGHIEFGETAAAAIRRELFEELGLEVGDAQFLFVLDNIYHDAGESCHEIDLFFEVTPLDAAWVERDVVVGEEDTGEALRMVWRDLEGELDVPLYPDGLRARTVGYRSSGLRDAGTGSRSCLAPR